MISYCWMHSQDVAHTYGEHAHFGRLDVSKAELKAHRLIKLLSQSKRGCLENEKRGSMCFALEVRIASMLLWKSVPFQEHIARAWLDTKLALISTSASRTGAIGVLATTNFGIFCLQRFGESDACHYSWHQTFVCPQLPYEIPRMSVVSVWREPQQ